MDRSFGILTPTESFRNYVQGTCTPQDHAHVGRTAHEAAHRPFFTCVFRALGCSVTTGRSSF